MTGVGVEERREKEGEGAGRGVTPAVKGWEGAEGRRRTRRRTSCHERERGRKE